MDLSQVEDLEEAVFTSLGAASACWEDIAGAGVFESDRCKQIGDGLVAWIKNHYNRTGTQVPYDRS